MSFSVELRMQLPGSSSSGVFGNKSNPKNYRYNEAKMKRGRRRCRPYRPMVYQIRVKGHLDRSWSEWFDDLTITPEADGETLLSGSVADQAALHGLLKKVRDLGLHLLLVKQLKTEDEKDCEKGRLAH